MYCNKKLIFLIGGLFFLFTPNLYADTVLRLSHQWPDNSGDMRHEMAKLIQKEIIQKDLGLRLDILAKDKLKNELQIRPWQQWSTMTSGHIDMTIYPLAYAGPKFPIFNITLMPGIIKNHAHARRFNNSKVMRLVKKIMIRAGVIVIADAWLAGGMVSNKGCLVEPDNIKGLWMRAAGITYNQMFAEAGGRISSMPSSKIKDAMNKNKLDGAITSSSSLVSYKIYEEAKCLIAPGESAIWFMYEPILMAKSSFDKLSKKQQQALLVAGKKAEEFGFKEAVKADKTLIEVYSKNGVTIKKLTNKQFDKWRKMAEKSSYKLFKDEIRNGKKILSWALEVE